MAHSIGLGIIGLDRKSDKILSGIIKNDIVPVSNIHVVEADSDLMEKYEKFGIQCEKDVSASTLMSEVMILSGTREWLNTTLAEICGVTRGKIIVSTVEGCDCEYISSRVANATHIVCVHHEEKNGKTLSCLTYSERFPMHMKSAIDDIFRSIGSVETEE